MKSEKKTPQQRAEQREIVKAAAANYKNAKKNRRDVFEHELNEILVEFANSKIPKWGGLIFNGVEV